MNSKVYSIDEIKEILKRTIKDPNVKSIVLFGSYAKNRATPNSDIDIVVDTEGVLRGFAFIALIDFIRNAMEKEVDGFERYEIIENSKIDEEIKRTGVVVYER